MIKYNEKHDANYDTKKDMWIDENCRSEYCEYCTERPSKPSEVKE